MKTAILKPLIRSIKASFGRYLAILAICALGVGFYAGLKNAEPAMIRTADTYTDNHNLYDFELLSTLGFTEDDVEVFNEKEGINIAEGGFSTDVYVSMDNYEESVFSLHTISENINTLEITEGRMPESVDECIADAEYFSAEDIGTVINISDSNSEDVTDNLVSTEFKIVGLAYSPVYLNNERGSTTLGDGKVDAFMYVPEEAYSGDYYTEIWVDLEETYELYSDEYKELIENEEPEIEALLKERADIKYEELLGQAVLMYGDMAGSMLSKPVSYILNREENAGLVTFESDAEIVDSISNAFPVFFVLIAALVCMTTMTRMVNDERTQIGTLKAMGYSAGKISAKYVLYSGSAALMGCIIGFFAGTWSIPVVIWEAYDIYYGFAELSYNFNPVMLIGSILVTLICSTGVTYVACGKELRSMPATLIRPKAPKKGKKVWLEYFKPLWKRLSFLSKVSVRNVFRYKRRMFMMILGIGGCTALLVTGFGIRDSVAKVTEYQYEDIMKFDLTVSFSDEPDDSDWEYIFEECGGSEAVYSYVHRSTVQALIGDSVEDVTMIAGESSEVTNVIALHNGNDEIAYPEGNEVVISKKLADNYELSVGDEIAINHDGEVTELLVSGICDNYVGIYIYTSEEILDKGFEKNTALIRIAEETDYAYAAASLRNMEIVSSVSVTEDEKAQMENSMTSINYIIVLIIISAAALAFIVLLNLTNINIMERVREIATVKVLGFYPLETSSYVLRENIVLSAFGAVAGLVLGKFLHIFVMSRINTDALTFDVRISALSYVISFVLTLLFAVIVNLFMTFRLEKINMSESLKTIE